VPDWKKRINDSRKKGLEMTEEKRSRRWEKSPFCL